MPNYILAYRGGRQPETPEEGKAQMNRWKTWLADMGDAMVNPGTPLGKSRFITEKGVSDTGPEPLTGYSIITAKDMDAALKAAKACPFTEIGTLEVAEIKSMGPS